MDSEEPERDATERTLRHGDEDAAFDGGAKYVGEPGEQCCLLVGVERNGFLDPFGQRPAVTQQEEQQIEHDAGPDHELERVHSDGERLGSENLSSLQKPFLELLAQGREIRQVETLDQPGGPGRQCVEYLLQVVA